MRNDALLQKLSAFDPELWEILQHTLDRQISTLSLIPTASAASPFSSYLKGSALGNDFYDHHATEHQGKIEAMAARRACELYGAEHAIVRIGNPMASSRVVLHTLAGHSGNTVLSFNLRKQELCTGSHMSYNFVKFSVNPDSLELDFQRVRELAQTHRPVLIIYSPVNYPRNIDYRELRKIADEVGAYFWVDLGQNAGLIAAGSMESPVPYADVATLAGGDALHGPQSGIILTKSKLADTLEQAVIDTGHVSLKKNVLAALAVTFREACCEEYRDYAAQVLINAQSLEKGLKKTGAETLCSPTQNHLVLMRLPKEQDGDVLTKKLAEAGLLVKAEHLMTDDDDISYPILRLSSLDPTTRALNEDDMLRVGEALGRFLYSGQTAQDIKTLHKLIAELVEDLPLFSEEWLPSAEALQDYDPELMMKAMVYWNV